MIVQFSEDAQSFVIYEPTTLLDRGYVYASNTLPECSKLPQVERSITEMILATFGTYDAVRVAECESGLNPNVVNNNPRTGDYSVGLFQINLYGKLALSRPSEEWLKVPENNIAYAYKMYQARGWKDWSCARTKGLI